MKFYVIQLKLLILHCIHWQVWAVDLDLRYSDQLAMTQMLQMMTGGSLNHHSGCLDVPMHVQGKHCEQQIADKVTFQFLQMEYFNFNCKS